MHCTTTTNITATTPPNPSRSPAGRHRLAASALAIATAGLLTACGGGGGSSGAECTTDVRKSWLASYVDDWYFWTAISPKPSASGNETLGAFFEALKYDGRDPTFPRDRWSYSTPTEQFDRFFGAGQTLGYGVMVAGQEVAGQAGRPLFVRYVEPGSPAAAAGIARGDELRALNGRAAADVVGANDFSALSADTAGQTLSLTVRRDGVDRSVSLTAAVYALAPVNGVAIVRSPGGRRVGWVQVKDMVSQAEAPYAQVFAQWAAAGVDEVVLDLRYNGGGLVSTATRLASYLSAARTSGRTFASLRFNGAHTGSNSNYSFTSPAPAGAQSLPRVYLLVGPRTASASELVINGLKPFVDAVTIGATTFGKPVGFQSKADGCGSTWSVVNFESVNADGQGRYWNGFVPHCAVAEDFGKALGSTDEPLLATALTHADTGQCGALAVTATAQAVRRATGQVPVTDDPAGRGGMLDR